MNITIYTITDCPFSKQEKEYLASHGLQFQEKNLESNREFLTEMLSVGNNFAGTPLTKIEKDDKQVVVLKGFTASEFDVALGFAKEEAKSDGKPDAKAEVKPGEPAAPVGQPVVAPQVEAAPPVVATTPVPPAVEQPVAPVTPAAPSVPVTDPAIASILNNLQEQAQTPVAPVAAAPATVAPPPVAPPAPGQPPVIPNPQF